MSETNDVRRDRRVTDQRASQDDGLVIDMTDARSTDSHAPEPTSPRVRDSSYYLG